MDNREIAKQFDLLAKLMELHGENPFKIRSYSTAYQVLRKTDANISALDEKGLMNIKGIGKAVAGKVIEFVETAKIDALEKIKEVTPAGLIEVLQMKGLGPKKVEMLWKELDITSLGELEYACLENRLLSLKGFGQKTQESLLVQISFLKQSRGQVLLSTGLDSGTQCVDILTDKFGGHKFILTGELRRRLDTIGHIEILGTLDSENAIRLLEGSGLINEVEKQWYCKGVRFSYYHSEPAQFGKQLIETTGPQAFTDQMVLQNAEEEETLFKMNNLKYVVPELRDIKSEDPSYTPGVLIEENDILGVIHAHSTWSDGVNSVQQMVDTCNSLGYSYLVLSDHSQSAFYANGLTEERLYQQWEEIDEVNQKNSGFRVFKGIESDILYNGALDYPDEILALFDVVIASVHSNLKMDESKANDRLIRAIENPHTHILGHMTGRLLLSRPGYPIDHAKIIDACAANEVSIEINSNPHRLDIDWRWLPYALEKGIKISISPDAHNKKGLEDVKYGVWMGRKGGLSREDCINCLSSEKFEKWASAKSKS